MTLRLDIEFEKFSSSVRTYSHVCQVVILCCTLKCAHTQKKLTNWKNSPIGFKLFGPDMKEFQLTTATEHFKNLQSQNKCIKFAFHDFRLRIFDSA